MKEKYLRKKEKGITLIALVVTIVVLLILAGVSISLVLGNNGLISKTKESREQTNQGTLKDEVSMIMGEWQIEKYTTNGNLEEFLSSKVPDKIDAVTNNGDGTFEIEKNGYIITVQEDGTVGEIAKTGPRPEVSGIKVVANSDGTGENLGAKSTEEGTTLYITFSHGIEGGTTTVSPAIPYAVTGNGTYTFTVRGTVGGEEKTKTVNVTVNQYSSALKIGDYVNYTYDEVAAGYTLLAKYSGYSSDQTVAQSSSTLKWRILNIDESSGKIDLVSETPSDNIVYFRGALGYNNGVYLLNEMCAELYSNKSKGITARSINLEDTEKHLTATGLAARNAYNSGYATYGSTKTYTDSYSYYPNLYAQEIGSGVNVAEANASSITQPDKSISNPDPYKESKAYYTSATEETYTQASEKALTVTQTYYNGVTFNEANYGEAGAVLNSSNYYWVASRYANCRSSYACFGLRSAGTNMYGYSVFYSRSGTDYDDSGLRPVVSLESNILDGTKDASGAWNLK